MTNEELAERIRGEDADSIEKLLQNNQEYLYKLARRLSRNPDTIEDLVQEGRIAILEATSSFDPAPGVLFLTYATPFIRKAMREFMARMSLPIAVPAARYSQLRRVHYLVAKYQMDNEERSLPSASSRLLLRRIPPSTMRGSRSRFDIAATSPS